ncbi:hypothetical protein NQ318_017333 [Aromia moschata]|uniref:Transposase Tc1-like domain-containing protein n=1 Tax=Aromia moschata TaxID=1265417 RepID=A0AAV8XXV6_9CUCU|nr:hypothetical protein NQ318_017333 [Aromia moschata]
MAKQHPRGTVHIEGPYNGQSTTGCACRCNQKILNSYSSIATINSALNTAIAKLEENWSLTEVAAELNVSKSCIFYIKKRWQGEQRLQRTIRQGIGKVSTENEDNALVEFINHNPFETAVKAREETLFPGSLRTTQRHLKQCGFKNCVAAHKMFLTEEHKQRQVQFANEFLQGNEFWNNVTFSDEKTFQSSKNERVHVYRSRNTRFEENYTLSTTNSGRFSVNVWAWISVHDPGVCWQIDGRLTSAHYTNILENVMLQSKIESHNEDLNQVTVGSITEEDVTSAIKRTKNWKAPGPDVYDMQNTLGIFSNIAK